MNHAKVIQENEAYTDTVEVSDDIGSVVCVIQCATEGTAFDLANLINRSVNSVIRVEMMDDWV